MKTALLLIDIQNDFLPGGALAVPHGDQILQKINELLKLPFDHKFATKDWHPHSHGSFANNHTNKKPGDRINLNGLDQILWPAHCIQNTPGAEFSPQWDSNSVEKVFFKGTDPSIDSYSAFFDNGHIKSTGLGEYLNQLGIDTLFIAGLATDYCVKFSVLDALKIGFKVYVIEDASKGVNLNPKDTSKALDEMQDAGAIILQAKDVHDFIR